MSLKRDIEFIFEIGRLRFVDRAWKQLFGPDLQNVSEHTMRVVWLSLIVAKYEKTKIDENKLIKMAIVHDLDESRTGDTHLVSRRYSTRFSQKAIDDIFKATALNDSFITIFQEFEKCKTLEAKIVKDADNLDVDIETVEAKSRGGKIPRLWRKFRLMTYKDFYTQSAKKIARTIERADPNDWHQLGRNRFNDGDWKK